MKFILQLILASALFTNLSAAPILVGMSWDTQAGPTSGIPRQVNQLNTGNSTATELFDLGNGSQGFISGLTYRETDSLLYSIAFDGMGGNRLVSFDPDGDGSYTAYSNFLPSGLYYGLTYSPDDDLFYVMHTLQNGYGTFYSIDAETETATALFNYYPHMGFSIGGFTWGPHGLQGLISEGGGNWRIYDVDLAGNTVNPTSSTFTGYYSGGFYYDPVTGGYYAITTGTDSMGTLVQLNPATGSATPLLTAGSGYYYIGLTGIGHTSTNPDPDPDPSEVPEPSSLMMAALGSALILIRMKRV